MELISKPCPGWEWQYCAPAAGQEQPLHCQAAQIFLPTGNSAVQAVARAARSRVGFYRDLLSMP